MKPLYQVTSLLVALLAVCSCSDGGGNTFTQASGRPDEVMLVMDRDYLADSVNTAVKATLRSYVPAMPQIEEQMDVMTVGPKDFDTFLRYVRNISIVDIDTGRYTQNSVKFAYDQWVHGQIVVTIQSPSPDSVCYLMADRGRAMLNLFARHELAVQANNLVKNSSYEAGELAVKHLDYHINAPEGIVSYRVGKNCLWLSDNAMRRRTDMLLYRMPYHGEALAVPYLVALRDSVLAVNVLGPIEGSHVVTASYILMTRQVSIEGQSLRIELRGLWELRDGGPMGGSLVQHAFVTPQGNELVVAEAFVYHPNETKRDMMQQVEAVLFSVRADSVELWDAEQVAQTRWTAYTTH